MKKSIVVLTLLALLAGGAGAAAVDQWHSMKQARVAAAQQAKIDDAQAAAHAQDVLADKADARRTVYLTLKAECVKGKTAYDNLAAPVKAKLAAPNCEQPGALESLAL